MYTKQPSTFETTSRNDMLHVSPESLPTTSIDQTQNTLSAQLLGEAAYRDLTSRSSFAPDGTELPNAYKLEQTPEFTPEAIRHSALMLAAETLPEATIDEYDIKHDIPDSVSYQCPPTYETTHLMIEAWEQTGHDDQVFGLIGDMLDFMQDRRMRDELVEALCNARDTGEDFRTHYELVKSRILATERQALQDEDNYIAMLPHHDVNDATYQPPLAAASQEVADAEYQERLVSNDLVVIPEYHSTRGSHSTPSRIEGTGTLATRIDPAELFED